MYMLGLNSVFVYLKYAHLSNMHYVQNKEKNCCGFQNVFVYTIQHSVIVCVCVCVCVRVCVCVYVCVCVCV